MTNPENFDPLLRLLALKKHEQQPPGYFDRFAREVIVRLKAGEAKPRFWLDDLFEEASWMRKVWAFLETKPVVAGLFGAAVSCLLLVGIVYSQKIERPSEAAATSPQEKIAFVAANPAFGPDQSVATLMTSSTNPVGMPAGLFDGIRLQAQPVSFVPERK